MKLEANNIEDFFAACREREPVMRELEKFISNQLSEQPILFSGMGSVNLLAWRLIDYKPKSASKSEPTRKWPMIAIALQKNYLALYICATKNGKYLTEYYQDKLGKVNCGKSCIRFKKLEDLKLSTVKLMLAETKNLNFGF
jgi:hypothetical protein